MDSTAASSTTPLRGTEDAPNESELDLSTNNRVDVIYLNINAGSDFRIFRTGTQGSVHTVIAQVAKHLENGLYRVVSLNASENSCVVVLSTERSREDLLWKNGFPWDVPETE